MKHDSTGEGQTKGDQVRAMQGNWVRLVPLIGNASKTWFPRQPKDLNPHQKYPSKGSTGKRDGG